MIHVGVRPGRLKVRRHDETGRWTLREVIPRWPAQGFRGVLRRRQDRDSTRLRGGGDCAGSAPGRTEGGRAGGRRADALVGGPAALLRRSAVGGFEACFVTYIGRAGKSISMPTPIGGGTVVTAEENYHPDVQEHFDRGAAPQAHRSAHVHMRRHRRTAVRRAAPVKAGIGQDGGDRSLDRRNCPAPRRARQAGNLAGWLSARAWARPGHHRAGAAIR